VRLAAVTLLALAALAAPASADTIAHRTPAVGPVFAGNQAAWGEETRAGALRIVAGRPVRVLHRVPAATAKRTDRSFLQTPWSFSASATHIAGIVLTNTITSEGSDFGSTSSAAAALGGPLTSLGVLSGDIPPSGEGECEGPYRSPEGVSVDGARIAIAERAGSCGGRDTRTEITILDGDTRRTVLAAADSQAVHVRLAGRFLAWVVGERRLVVHDLDTGTDVATVTRFAIGDLDVDPSGAVAFTFANGPRARRLGLLQSGTVRTLDRRVADRGVAIAGGRVLYEKLGRRDFHSRLMLRNLSGGTRRLASFTGRRTRVGDVDLAASRATWAARRKRPGYDGRFTAPARIVGRWL
jgi:hypothetical protein